MALQDQSPMTTGTRSRHLPLPLWITRFDRRTNGVLASEIGAIPLLAVGMMSPGFVKPGLHWLPAVIIAYTCLSATVTITAGRLSDRQFVALSFGGMIGIALSAFLIQDNGAAFAVLVLLAAVPALAAMESRPWVVIFFVGTAVVLAGVVVSIRATSWTALVIGGGAVLMAIAVPTYMVTSLRRSLTALLAQQAELSVTDPLTLALNRRGLFEGAEKLLLAAERSGYHVGFMVADVDNFKLYNDTNGHSAGDTILVDITTTLKAAVPSDSLVARTGGEEFVILTIVGHHDDLTEICESVRRAVESTTEATVSVGGVSTTTTGLRDRHGTPLSHALILDFLSARADQLLYVAKALGRNRTRTAHVSLASRDLHDHLTRKVPKHRDHEWNEDQQRAPVRHAAMANSPRKSVREAS